MRKFSPLIGPRGLSSRTPLRNAFLAGASLTLCLASPRMQAQPAAAGCTLAKGAYTCDWQAFRARFAAAHTISIAVQPMERSTEKSLRQLAEALGKSVAAPEQPADLSFRVAPANTTGVAIGPADQPLASLQVFAPAQDGGRETLLWVETFIGQADRPWPATVTALLDQFHDRFRKRGK